MLTLLASPTNSPVVNMAWSSWYLSDCDCLLILSDFLVFLFPFFFRFHAEVAEQLDFAKIQAAHWFGLPLFNVKFGTIPGLADLHGVHDGCLSLVAVIVKSQCP